MIEKFLFADTESTGLDEEDRIVEFAIKWYEGSTYEEGPTKYKEYSYEVRCKAPLPIKIGAMSVTGIRNCDVENLPSFNDIMFDENTKLPDKIRELLKTRTLVCHNLPFDSGMLAKENVEPGDGICTLKLAHYIFPEMEKTNMQFLRYYFWENDGIDMSLPKSMEPHQALADVVILEKVFYRIVKEFANQSKEFTIQKAIETSNNPVLLYKYSMGKYKEKPVTYEELVKIDSNYCNWIVTKSELSDDIKYSVQYWIDKAREESSTKLAL